MIVLTIADLINSINLFSTVFTPCLIACPSLSGIWACGPHPCPACKHPSLRDFVAPEALRHPSRSQIIPLSPGFRRAGGAPTSLPRLRRGVAYENKKSAFERTRR